MASDEDDLGWAGGTEQQAARAELERLKKLGEGLRDLTAAAGRIADPDELAAVQDRNLEAFEAMTAEMGLAALDRMRQAIELLSDPEKAAAYATGAADLAARSEAIVAAAQSDIEAARDRETAALLKSVGARFEAAGRGAAGQRQRPFSGFDFEPFDGGSPEPDWDRGASPLQDMLAEDGPPEDRPSEEE